MIGGNVEKEVDLEKLVKEFKSIEESFGFSIIVAFDDGGPVGLVGKDLASIKEALNNHNKIFVEIGFLCIMMLTLLKNHVSNFGSLSLWKM